MFAPPTIASEESDLVNVSFTHDGTITISPKYDDCKVAIAEYTSDPYCKNSGCVWCEDAFVETHGTIIKCGNHETKYVFESVFNPSKYVRVLTDKKYIVIARTKIHSFTKDLHGSAEAEKRDEENRAQHRYQASVFSSSGMAGVRNAYVADYRENFYVCVDVTIPEDVLPEEIVEVYVSAYGYDVLEPSTCSEDNIRKGTNVHAIHKRSEYEDRPGLCLETGTCSGLLKVVKHCCFGDTENMMIQAKSYLYSWVEIVNAEKNTRIVSGITKCTYGCLLRYNIAMTDTTELTYNPNNFTIEEFTFCNKTWGYDNTLIGFYLMCTEECVESYWNNKARFLRHAVRNETFRPIHVKKTECQTVKNVVVSHAWSKKWERVAIVDNFEPEIAKVPPKYNLYVITVDDHGVHQLIPFIGTPNVF